MRFFKEYYSLLAASVGRILPEKKMPDEQPLRAELFSVDQFKLHAEHIARTHQVRFKPGREKLLSRLKENEKILLRAYDLLNDAGKAKRRISPAGEWLLDNYYLVEEHIRLAKQYLPKGYSRELPHLTRGPLAGCPRVYDIAMEMVSHGDGRVDLRGLAGFVSAYQSVSHLKIGELWAIPIMMRLALIENLRRVSARMVSAQRDRDKADYWASRIMEVPGKDANGVLLEIGAMASAGLALTSSFVAEFVRRLHGQSSTLNLPLIWLEKALSEHGENIDRLIQLTNRNQAADQVSIANTIGSLRLLQVTDWHDFVEEMSIVDATLRRDPSGDYRMMSFDTRDRYRHVIEMLAMRSGCTEEYAALKTVELAEEAKVSNGPDDVSAHVGYYLIDGGMPRLYRLLGLRLFVSEYIQAQRTTLPFALYTGAIAGTTCLASAGALFLAWHLGVRDGAALAVLGVLLLISASQPAVALVNWLATVLVLPQRLPKMDFSEGIPAHAHTLVAVPAMLCDARVVESLIENLEVRYLANVDANVDFALLTDFCDAAHETMPDDDAVLGQAKAGIEKLNHKYRRHKDGIFYLLHRRRRWNQREGVWMGYERKRGKLGALNAFLRGRAPDAFSDIVGDPSRLQDVKYVITLDTDTRMPRDVARDMAGIIAHPLNRPVYDEKKKRVTAGYGILQPRVEVSYPGDNPSLFVKVYGGESGIDPYTKTVSDVYQDLFHEGSFIGKGLYDVDAVERSLAGRFPDNLILSHDLLEGCYARSALVSDVQLYEAYPSAYLKDMYRRHRWIRGDWQIARWIFPFVPGPGGTRVNNPLSVLSRWKILDNLRRSLVPVSTSLLFPAGWFFMSPSGAWTAMAVLFIALPPLLMSLVGIARKPRESLLRAHLYAAVYAFGLHAVQCFFSLIFILYESFVSINAIATTFWRMLISRRRLLEWSESGESDLNFPKTLPGYVKKMSLPALTSLVVVCLAPLYLHADALAVMVAAMWLFSPAAAYLISRPSAARTVRLSAEQVLFLRRFSRKAWSFFETFVGERDNWLPPDNFQEEPRGAVAHRTSPTNIGLSLLSNLAAYDFGYVSMGRMFNRTEKTLTTMNRMAKFRGHLYNWYDTESLQPMEPLYISSVDSGNLVGHLLVLRSGLTELADKKIVSLKIFDGLSDTLHVLGECVTEAAHNTGGAAAEAGKKAAEKIDRLNNKIESPPALLSEIHALLRQLPADVANIVAGLDQIQYEHASKWGRAFENQCLDHLEDIAFIAPWVLLPPEIPGMWDTGDDRHKERLARLREELRRLDEIPVLGAVARLEMKLIALIDEILEHAIPSGGTARDEEWFMKLREAIKDAGTRSSERISAVDYIVLQCTELSSVEYEFLYDRVSRLLSIGFNVKERLADPSCYDLLASEARLCSFVAIAQGRMPQDHWFMLGRMLSTHGGDPVLVSWGGSMFEYLMPLLVMPTYEGTLLDRTYRAAISRQIDYASRNNIPWGISESGYNKIDSTTTYQYRSFGVPDTGFKRGLSEDLVVAPYASTLALMVEPEKACENLQQLHESGFGGEYGFYEAIDYTPSRLAHGESHAIVKSFMAHHQGMSFLSLAHLLLGRPMQRRFLADPMFKATELLLQERVPKEVPFLYDIEVTVLLRKVEERESLLRVFTTPHTATPEIYLLSNGRYSVMVTNAGGGYSHWKKLAVTRWQEDSSLDNAGSFIYLRDIESGNFWSTAYQPTLNTPRSYQAIFSQSRAEFKRRDYRIDTHTQIAVSPEDDIELRRVKITNTSNQKRFIEVTSCAEVVLNYPAADAAHKTFSNLFVQTEIIRPYQAIICTRRPRSDTETFPVMLHLMAVHGNAVVGASYETDRGKFIGRGNTFVNPAAMQDEGGLSNTEGSVLDPVVSIRCRIALEPEDSAIVDYVTGICDSREHAHVLMDKYRDRNLTDRVFDLAWTHGQVGLQQINATEADALLYVRLASAIVYANPAWRAHESILRQNLRGQSDLWGYSISGDLPVVLVRIEDPENIDVVARMVQAHSYWRMKGLRVDLLIWNENHSVYRDTMSERIQGLISANAGGPSEWPGGIFLRRSDQMSEEDRILMQTVARIIITDKGGTLGEQAEYRAQSMTARPSFVPARKPDREYEDEAPREDSGLSYFNGLGGFTRDGREYVITTGGVKTTPAPWVNVVANRHFGTVISESGSAYTWSENAHEFRLTPWKNDPVTDASGEALYIRDEQTGSFWSPTPLPAKGKTRYVSRHGFGYSIFEHEQDGIVSEFTVFVSLEHPAKFAVLKLKNISGRARRLSALSFNELVMGTDRNRYHTHIVTEVDPKSGALLAHNHYNKDFPDRVVFLDVSEPTRFFSGDRGEFLGRNGTMAAPAVMRRDRLSGKTGAGLDPCAAVQVFFDLDEGSEKEIVFTFGAAKSQYAARGILQRFNGPVSVRQELENVWGYWKRTLGVVHLETPDSSLNYLANGWLQYQVISCRLWGRSGLYQSGGAYGFRDQLQDVMSLMHSAPGMVREHLLTCASRQFIEGDVQHWWHPPSGRGVRTRCSDDYLWLALVTCLYVEEIGDTGILDESIPFLEGPPVKPGEESYYDMPRVSGTAGTLYEHCVAAVKHGLTFGVHGLPLMGSGDWNDGMNLVGKDGKGESVWLAFFLHHVLTHMSALALKCGDTAFADVCRAEAGKLALNIEAHAWDGQWYHRAYFDNGDVLGSSSNAECRIDSLPQSWAVISGAVGPERAVTAMDQADQHLVSRKDSLIKLFEPPFNICSCNPGYIKGYVPGVRENGGQYTHAAVWMVIAFAMLKDRKRAWELLNMINPARHGDSEAACSVYKVEPYVMAADVYAVTSNAGRGGWTWYTGAASWMYQLIVKYLMGLRLDVDRLYFEPCLPEDWQSFKIHYRYRETFYHITVRRSGPRDTVLSVTVDGAVNEGRSVPLVDDRVEHAVDVVLG